jgi:hypothetical protein
MNLRTRARSQGNLHVSFSYNEAANYQMEEVPVHEEPIDFKIDE